MLAQARRAAWAPWVEWADGAGSVAQRQPRHWPGTLWVSSLFRSEVVAGSIWEVQYAALASSDCSAELLEKVREEWGMRGGGRCMPSGSRGGGQARGAHADGAPTSLSWRRRLQQQQQQQQQHSSYGSSSSRCASKAAAL